MSPRAGPTRVIRDDAEIVIGNHCFANFLEEGKMGTNRWVGYRGRALAAPRKLWLGAFGVLAIGAAFTTASYHPQANAQASNRIKIGTLLSASGPAAAAGASAAIGVRMAVNEI